MERLLTHLSLFSGIGGLDLAAEAAGFVTVGQCEWADYPTKILEKHWPDVPRWRDIRTFTGESFYERTGLRTVDVISGGFPCQPFSHAGKQRGESDDRFLWPEMLRVVEEIRPAWVLGENVPGIIDLALDRVLSDLENRGYAAQAFIVPAGGVDSPQKRDRVVIIARDWPRTLETKHYGNRWTADRLENGSGCGCCKQEILSQQQRRTESERDGNDLADTESVKRNRSGQRAELAWGSEPSNGGWWPSEPDVGRVAHGIPNRVDRIKCLGNAVVPQQFFPFFAAIAEIEKKS